MSETPGTEAGPVREAGPLYVYFDSAYHGAVSTIEVRPGILFDVDPANRLLGIEILDYESLTLDGVTIARAEPESDHE